MMQVNGNFFPRCSHYLFHLFNNQVIISGFDQHEQGKSVMLTKPNFTSQYRLEPPHRLDYGILNIRTNQEDSQNSNPQIQLQNNNNNLNSNNSHRVTDIHIKKNKTYSETNDINNLITGEFRKHETDNFLIVYYTQNMRVQTQLYSSSLNVFKRDSSNTYLVINNPNHQMETSQLKLLKSFDYNSATLLIKYKYDRQVDHSHGFYLYDLEKQGVMHQFERRQWMLADHSAVLSDSLILNGFCHLNDFSSTLRLYDVRTQSHVLKVDGTNQQWNPNFSFFDQISPMQIGTVWMAQFTTSQLFSVDLRKPYKRMPLSSILTDSIKIFRKQGNRLWTICNIISGQGVVKNRIICEEI